MNDNRLVIWIVPALVVSLLVTSVYGCACLNKQAEIRAEAEKTRQNCVQLMASLNISTVIQNQKQFEDFCLVINDAFACLNHTMVNYSHVAYIRKNRMMLDLARGLKAKICMKSNGSQAAQEYGRCHNQTLFDHCMPPEETSDLPDPDVKELCRFLAEGLDCTLNIRL